MIKAYDNFVKLAINPPTGGLKNSEAFLALKKEISGKLGLPIPTNADLRETYEKLVKQKKVKRDINFEKIMLSRRVRTQSGVAVVAVLTKSHPCPGKCIYCPAEKGMPKSYLSNEPAVMRAIASKFNPYLQVWNRLRSLELNGHKTDKIELIIMGGTFSVLPSFYQKNFVCQCFKACNDFGVHKVYKVKKSIKSLKKLDYLLLREQKRNERARHRIVGLTLETRPDYIDENEILNFRKLGSTRVELGVQSIFDDVLKLNKRGHDAAATIRATELLKNAGFKINYHIMPGLPGSSLKKDYEMFEKLFSNSDFRPDMLKIYPTVVVKNSALYKIWKNKKALHLPSIDNKCRQEYYKPLNDMDFTKFILRVKNEIIPPYVRISRLVRDVPSTSIVAGPKLSNLRQMIAKKSRCRCIRCREVGADYNINEKIILNRIDYSASGGEEIFLQYVSPDKRKLFALLRLRISNNTAIVREVHTYGKLTEINKKDKNSPQHMGLGKKLMQEAEKIAKEEFGIQKMAVISGIGAREYYRKLGYKLKDTYMVKNL